MRTGEPTINTALAEVLGNHGHGWTVHGEGRDLLDHGVPDVLVMEHGWPVVIETEVNNHRSAEWDALQRLGNKLAAGLGGRPIHAALALVYPDALRDHQGRELRRALESSSFEYALYTMNADGTHARFPRSGWITGGIRELALLVHRCTVPAWQVDDMADELEKGVLEATALVDFGAGLGEVLGQEDDDKGQTRRMAMTVLADALVFHSALAEARLHLPVEGRAVKPPEDLRLHGRFSPSRLRDEWEAILEVNYWPIFHTARRILKRLPTKVAGEVLNVLWNTAEALIVHGVTRSHDLTGTIFQRLIADRKFLATFYTRPAAAALLTGLAMPVRQRDWSNADALAGRRIGDFACGTGTLLSSAYARLGLLHQVHGGNPVDLHPTMMKEGLVGLDVLPVAVHLTAAMLAGMYPQTPFDGECLLTMPYGRNAHGVNVGSLDLLEEQPTFEAMEVAAEKAGPMAAERVHGLPFKVAHGTFDIVIMNPPFKRATSHEGAHKNVPNPAFAAFEESAEGQRLIATRLKHLNRSGRGHGNAGLATHFVDLVHRKLNHGGKMALVLPLSALSGKAWEKVRALWRTEYSNITVVTIAGTGSHDRSFSADTGIAECLIVADRKPPTGPPQATFVMLAQQSPDPLVGAQLATAITDAVVKGVEVLENGPYGATSIRIGDTDYGHAFNGNLPTTGLWWLAGISSPTLAQIAHQLATGHLWIDGTDAHPLPIAPVRALAGRGPIDRDINGTNADKSFRGPFDMLPGCPPGTAYPTLWKRNTKRARRLVVAPDSHCRIRTVGKKVPAFVRERAAKVWATAGRTHYNRDFQLNANSLAVAFTEQPAIGGRAWPTVLFEDPRHEYAFALWCNSTLGLMLHWWSSNKSQAGRGTTTVTGIQDFPTLDVRTLDDRQLTECEAAFNDLRSRRFLPFNQLHEDPARAELDRRLLAIVLGPPALMLEDAMQRLRLKLASEPQIDGGKKSKVVFTEHGEESRPRKTPLP